MNKELLGMAALGVAALQQKDEQRYATEREYRHDMFYERWWQDRCAKQSAYTRSRLFMLIDAYAADRS